MAYVILYKNDTWGSETGRYDFPNKEDFISWTDPQNDNLSSFKFLLPVGWELRIHKHRDRDSEYFAWRGTGQEESINKNQIPGWLHDEASGHSWVPIA